jgi:anaerobic magnesium-protoporphyrin IX monomethyl ester cyclase
LRIHFGYFFQNLSHPISILGAFAEKKGYEIELCQYLWSDTEETIKEKLISTRPDLVAISFMLHSRNKAFLVAKVARDLGAKVIAGGIHPTLCPEDVKRSGLFDVIVVGDGLGVIDEILEGYKKLNGKVISGRTHPEDALYFDRYFTDFQKRIIKETKKFEIFTSFGCPHSCAFCVSSESIKFRQFALKPVIETLVKAKSEFDIEEVFPQDETFAENPARVRDFREKLKDKGLSFRFGIQARTSSFTDELADELKKLGVYQVAFGVETASERLLKMLKKNATVADAFGASEICKRFHIEFHVFIIVALPTQTKEDYECTLEFIRETKPDGVIVSHFTPFPGTKLFEYCIQNKYITRCVLFQSSPRLNKIDYDMALHYQKKMEELVPLNREEIGQGPSLDVFMKP